MTEQIASDIWRELKTYINTNDREDAAQTIIDVLINNDSDIENIRNAFAGDAVFKRALTAYLDQDIEEAEVDEDESDEDEY